MSTPDTFTLRDGTSVRVEDLMTHEGVADGFSSVVIAGRLRLTEAQLHRFASYDQWDEIWDNLQCLAPAHAADKRQREDDYASARNQYFNR